MRNIPRPILIRFSFIFSKIISIFYIGKNVYCPVCERNFRKFLPYGAVKRRDNVLCPNCLSLERHRLLWLFLKKKTSFFTSKLKVMHMAPEQPFLKKFRNLKNLDYQTGDLVSPLADVKFNIENIPFQENIFDVFICNHVLEHVDNDLKAMQEIFRVLKIGGFAILQVPIDISRKETYEDKTITDPFEREKHFWQKDHLRLYGLDYAEKLRSVGFKVTENDFAKEFSPNELEKLKFDRNEIIYFIEKK